MIISARRKKRDNGRFVRKNGKRIWCTDNYIRRLYALAKLNMRDECSIDGMTWEPLSQVPQLVPEYLIADYHWTPND